MNQSDYRVLENKWAKALKEGKQVSVDIKINYGDGFRPDSFEVAYRIDDKEFWEIIENIN
ncbi:MAG: DNA/RNA non-specific endonuclease [Eggerthellaceae bacterium]|nr:DNA/RNA non-specific endonuclease [Eggerthellaceae bacterium]